MFRYKYLITLISSIFFNVLVVAVFAQDNPIPHTNHVDRDIKSGQRKVLSAESIAAHLPIKNIGPTIFSGRVTDINANPDDPTQFLVTYASGGLWVTYNNGTTFSPLFDQEASMTIGDIHADWDSKTIWIGTGEVNSSRSSYAGTGIYKSENWGKNWTWKGLPESHHIGRIIVHPEDANQIWVAVLGHLYSTNPERGIFYSNDGGNTWGQSLYIDDNTGAVDLIIDPDNPDILYAATWERSRRAWNFIESGKGSGIYKTTDGGNGWDKINIDDSGFPQGDGVGRIGLCIADTDSVNILYAILDNYNRRPKEKSKDDDKETLTKNDLKNMSADDFLKLPVETVNEYLKNNGFPKKYSAKDIIDQVKDGDLSHLALVEYLENANSLLFDTPVIGAEVYKSLDGGMTWSKTHDEYLDGVYNSYGYYFGMIEVSPQDPNQVYIMGVPILRSDDGGQNWRNAGGDNVHADHHALWLNPHREGHIINGNDGGVNISYDAGENWIKCNSPAVGQFYYINADMAEPYNVYGGTQDNGVWVGSHQYREGVSWHSYGQYPYKTIMGGDGMQVQIDSRDNTTVYTGFQFGNYFRINKDTGTRVYITPKHELGDRPYRWNWQSPIHLSVHNEDILYMGAHKLLRSLDQGVSFKEISDDLTGGGRKGDVPYGTLTSIHESPLTFGLLYTGSDDGLVHVSRDGGYTWQNISDTLPKELWVSRVQASAHDEGTVYLSLNGYRWDDFSPYVYKSSDYGQSWASIAQSLPVEPINVIKEDPHVKGMLYVGTDHGVYLSQDDGMSWHRILDDMPHTPVHDLVIHPRTDDLLIGTHGRSIWKTNVADLRKVKELDQDVLHLVSVDKIRYTSRQGNTSRPYQDPYISKVNYHVYSPKAKDAIIKIATMDGKLLQSYSINLKKGLSEYNYDLSIDPSHKRKLEKYINRDREKNDRVKLKRADNDNYYLLPGVYMMKIESGSQTTEQKFEVVDQ